MNITSQILCRIFASTERQRIYNPFPKGIREILPPEKYAELQGMQVENKYLTTSDGARIAVWEKKAEKGMPHFILYHGNTGHWGDAGPEHVGKSGYKREAYLNFLKAIGKTGAGFTAVHLRGFGNSINGNKKNKKENELYYPCEDAFRKDADRVIDHVLKELDVPSSNVIVSGISLGTAPATITAEKMCKNNTPPRLLALCNPFANMALQASNILNKICKKKYGYDFDIRPEDVEKNLHSPFRTDESIRKLALSTGVYIYNSGIDQYITPKQGGDLTIIAKSRYIDAGDSWKPEVMVRRLLKPDLDHFSIPIKEVVEGVMKQYFEIGPRKEQKKWAKSSLNGHAGENGIEKKNITPEGFSDPAEQGSYHSL